MTKLNGIKFNYKTEYAPGEARGEKGENKRQKINETRHNVRKALKHVADIGWDDLPKASRGGIRAQVRAALRSSVGSMHEEREEPFVNADILDSASADFMNVVQRLTKAHPDPKIRNTTKHAKLISDFKELLRLNESFTFSGFKIQVGLIFETWEHYLIETYGDEWESNADNTNLNHLVEGAIKTLYRSVIGKEFDLLVAPKKKPPKAKLPVPLKRKERFSYRAALKHRRY